MTESETHATQMPRWQDFMIPTLRVLSNGAAWSRRDLMAAVLDEAHMSAEQRSVILNSGQPMAENRIGWAISDLTRATAIYKPARGQSVITAIGRELLDKYPKGLDKAHLQKIAAYRDYQPRAVNTGRPPGQDKTPQRSEDLAPTEQIEDGISRIHTKVGDELLIRLRESHPDFFEQAVVDLLLKMGYGGAEQRGKRIGGSGDGGVDGVIDQDALGLDQIYVQAKRYKEGNNVGRETIQAFIGALHGAGASRGVFITTSSFTENARAYATNIPSRVILIDSQRLVGLMIKYRVGVQAEETYTVVAIDEDFFE